MPSIHWAADIAAETLCGFQRLPLWEWMDWDETVETCFRQEMNQTYTLLKIYPLLYYRHTNAHTVTMMFTGFAIPFRTSIPASSLPSQVSRNQARLVSRDIKQHWEQVHGREEPTEKNSWSFARNQEEYLKSCRQSQKKKFRCIHILWCLSYRKLLSYHISAELLKATMLMFLPIPPVQ